MSSYFLIKGIIISYSIRMFTCRLLLEISTSHRWQQLHRTSWCARSPAACRGFNVLRWRRDAKTLAHRVHPGVPCSPQLGDVKPRSLIDFPKLSALRFTVFATNAYRRHKIDEVLCGVSISFIAEAVYNVAVRMERIKLPVSQCNGSWSNMAGLPAWGMPSASIGSKVLDNDR